ncbi:hypothetical protein WNY77_09625 [Paraglaciecola mesophila]|uniref:Uncharacterized protein n=1 Tax=Paraglaciecola mesophila TaxID=197222 RepID=A0ABU9SUU2_9ALTE
MYKYAPVFISLSLAGLYALGLAFHTSYLYELGIEESQFSLSIDRLFFQGFLALMDFSSKGILWLTLSAFFIAILASLGVEAMKSLQILPAEPKYQKEHKKPENWLHARIISFAKTISYTSAMGLTIFVLCLIILIASGNSGEASAKKRIQKFVDGEIKTVEIKRKNIKKTIVGNPVICSESQCAYWTNIGSLVLNKSDIEWVKTK